MSLSKAQKVIGLFAGIICFIQGLLLFTFSLLCLIYYYKFITIVDPDATSITTAIHLRFLDDHYFDNLAISSADLIVDPIVFMAFNWVYVVFDLFWFLRSLVLVYDFATNDQKLRRSIGSFVWLTTLICILDAIFVVCLGVDYDKTCTGPITELEEKVCENGALPVLIIVAKGFVLWIANVVLIFLLRRMSGRIDEVVGDVWSATYVIEERPVQPEPVIAAVSTVQLTETSYNPYTGEVEVAVRERREIMLIE